MLLLLVAGVPGLLAFFGGIPLLRGPLSPRLVVLSVMPAVVMVAAFYTLAIHMYRSLGGWPAFNADSGFSSALKFHADVAQYCSVGLFLILFVHLADRSRGLRRRAPVAGRNPLPRDSSRSPGPSGSDSRSSGPMGSCTGGGTEARTPSRLSRRDGRCPVGRRGGCRTDRRDRRPRHRRQRPAWPTSASRREHACSERESRVSGGLGFEFGSECLAGSCAVDRDRRTVLAVLSRSFPSRLETSRPPVRSSIGGAGGRSSLSRCGRG